MIAAGKKAIVDGSVLVARNCDSVSTDALRIVSVSRRVHAPGSNVIIPVSRELPNDAAVASGWKARPITLPQVRETYAYTAAMRFVSGDEMGMVMGGRSPSFSQKHRLGVRDSRMASSESPSLRIGQLHHGQSIKEVGDA